MRRERVLVLDDDAEVVAYLVEMLAVEGYDAEGETRAEVALERVLADDFDLLVSDVEMPGMRGLELLSAVHARKPDQLILLITAFGSVDLAVRALREGACDFVTKPFRIEVLLHAVERALRERQMRREIVRLRQRADISDDGLVARSPAMRRVLEVARRAARTDATVLLTGESGTGKGVVARFIHDQGDRSAQPFVQVNCAAIPASLVESELFGVRRGAFTDARDDRDGLFVEAAGGTLFLDEVGELPLDAQPKLLQALETGRVRPVGGSSDVAAHPRVIAATNRPLEEELRERRFRPDLYYRLNVIHIDVPPLRERREDIAAFVDHFLAAASARMERSIQGVSRDAMRWILGHDWPGNVRELANTLERAVALTDHDILGLDDMSGPEGAPGANGFLDEAVAARMPLEEVKARYVRQVLSAVGGNRSEAARVLGIDRRTLYRHLEAAGGS